MAIVVIGRTSAQHSAACCVDMDAPQRCIICLFLVSGMTQHDGRTRERDGDGSSADEERVTANHENKKKVCVLSPKDGETDAGGNASGDDDVDHALHEKVPSVEWFRVCSRE